MDLSQDYKVGNLIYCYDWDREGAIYMRNAKTVERYQELTEKHPNSEDYGIFWAFSNKQFDEGYKLLVKRGFIKDGEKVKRVSAISGMFGASTKHIESFFAFYADKDKLIAAECDPQEVYFYECNNHEYMYDWDGDAEPLHIIYRIWGREIAEKIHRVRPNLTLDEIIKR